MSAILPDLEILTLRVDLRAQAAGSLPGFMNAALRGAFGHALRRIAATADELGTSAYDRIFQGALYPGRQAPPGKTPPPPFLIRCSCNGPITAPQPRQVERGDSLKFNLTLIGFACDEIRVVALAIEDLAAAGLGAARLPFELESIECLTVQGPTPLDLRATHRPVGVPLGLLASAAPPASPWQVQFLTPLQIRSSGELVQTLDGERFLRTVKSRLSALERNLSPNPRPAKPPASSELDLEWQTQTLATIERHSSRQQKNVNMTGYVGTANLHADVDELYALLLAGAVVGVGHGTTQGCGQYVLTAALPLLDCYGAGHP